MKKEFIVKSNLEIKNIIDSGKKTVNSLFVIYYKNNNKKHPRYCISVSKKNGKAHTRNYYKRIIKNILFNINVENNLDYVIILRNAILEKDYVFIKNNLENILKGK